MILKIGTTLLMNQLSLPATINKRSLIVDPTPPKGGLMNAPPAEICFDDSNSPNLLYRKI